MLKILSADRFFKMGGNNFVVIIIDRGRLIYDGNLVNLGRKYADHKVITAHFEKAVNGENFKHLGKIKTVNEKSLVLTVPKSKAISIATDLLNNYRIRDFDIEEPELEDIISIIFSHKTS